MSAALYNAEILRLATEIPHQTRLSSPHGSIEMRSPVCGSRVTVDVVIGTDGRIAALGQEVRACALGQASASLMARNAIGKTPVALADARDALSEFLAGGRTDPGGWPGLDIFKPAIPHKARHASIKLAFEAVAAAAAQAQASA